MCYDACCSAMPSSRQKCCCGCCLVDCCEWCHEGSCAYCIDCCCCRTNDPNERWNHPDYCCCGLCWNPCSCVADGCEACRYRFCTCQVCCCICDPLACCCGEYQGDIRLLEKQIHESHSKGAGAPQSEDQEMSR